MAKIPLISVIMPTYNAITTINGSLESIKKQTYKNYEIIVVDDGSFDGTTDLLKKMNDVNLFMQSNQGVSVARNKGVQEAKGDLIAFLDSDDLWHPQKLEIQLKLATTLQNFGIVSCRYKTVTELQEKPNFPQLDSVNVMPQEISFYRFLQSTFCLPSTVLIPKNVFIETGGFDPEYFCGEDQDLWLKIAYKYPVYHIPLDLMWYYKRPEGLSEITRINGHINSVFIIEKWNPKKIGTLDTAKKIDQQLFEKHFKQLIIEVGKAILKYRTIACLPNKKISTKQVFNVYWKRFAYIFGLRQLILKDMLILRNVVKYSFRRIKRQEIDEKLFNKLSTTKFG